MSPFIDLDGHRSSTWAWGSPPAPTSGNAQTQTRGTTVRISTTRDLAMMVREARILNHMTQADLAEHLGVSRAWVIRLEQGAPRIELCMVLMAMRSLGLETSVRFTHPFE